MIRFVYFDLGNVILNFDHRLGCQRVAQRWGIPAADVFDFIYGGDLQDRYERGMVSSGAYCQGVRSQLGIAADDAELLDSLSDMFTMNPGVLALAGQLAGVGISIGLLSNTCPAHWHWIRRRYPVCDALFPIQVLSYEVGVMKPEPGIYRAAMEAVGVPPEQIFFLDDRVENVAGARAVGLAAEPFVGVGALRAQLHDHGLRFNH